ncbi:hypothetical protein [Lactococcus cremoris]|uniref:hypothetical protein n=1 Tax=Lactococcus lactis subsp. cremoris TaxID=1359 RepID=UPI00038AF334|nr:MULTISPECIES: hypothetical protein [Lactococcus]EQC56555.1 hypothetical protein LLT5_07625 [Lactococcus cremoris subsp. cremoris TIFN5]EQC83890.1 hypothetical protein LLT1_03615 [Lactococcus cremoris subsp. cremoris TIFN1]QGJ84446.1 hypothetical protein [Lactococcus phage proPhi1]QGJ84606.1 hypothetical protein [Lactococcus phage proPhi5]AXN65092.1 phage-encoded protein [Lactococcus cremoris]
MKERIIVPELEERNKMREILEQILKEDVYDLAPEDEPDILENLRENLKLIGQDICKKNYIQEYRKRVTREFFKRIYKENEYIENICFCLEGYFEEEFDEDLFADEEQE